MTNVKPEFIEFLKSGDFTLLAFEDSNIAIYPGKHSPEELESLINNDQIDEFSFEDILIDPDGDGIYMLEVLVSSLGGNIVYA